MAVDGQLVLLLASHLMAGGNVFGGDRHVDLEDRIVETFGQRIEQHRIAQPLAPARFEIVVRHVGHAFGPARYRDPRLAQLHHLRAGNDRLHTRTTQAIERQRRSGDRNIRLEHGDAGHKLVLGAGLHDLTHDDMLDIVRGNPRAHERFGEDLCAKIGGAEGFQRSAEITDGGAHGGDDVDVWEGHFFSCVIALGCTRRADTKSAISSIVSTRTSRSLIRAITSRRPAIS